MTTIVRGAYAAGGIAADTEGNLYVNDNYRVLKMTSTGGTVPLAGGATAGSGDGIGAVARFGFSLGLAVGPSNKIYVADANNNTIRDIVDSTLVRTLAGAAGTAGSVDGTGSVARFNHPSDVAVDAVGNVYIVDTENSTIRRGRSTVDLHFETESLATTAALGTVGTFDDANWSEGRAASLKATAAGNFVTYSVPIPRAGTYRLMLRD